MKDFTAYLNKTQEIGYVEQIEGPIVYVNGLPSVKPEEIVVFETGDFGQVLSIEPDLVEVLIFSKDSVKPGARATRTDELLEIPVGFELLGQMIDPLGNSIHSIKPSKKPSLFRPIRSTPLGIEDRKIITVPLETGVMIVDLLMPLGLGQRELVIGDRTTGKTNFLMKTAISQAKKGNICIYAAIGKKKFHIKQVEEFFVRNKALDKVVIIASASEDCSGLIYIAPFTAMTISEYFRDEGNNVILILDDMTTHAKFYREISLLGKRFPGRSSYPSDIFYTHAKILERAGNFITDKGEHSITCFPVAETTQGDLSGYIETNLMSMTDGYLYFDKDLYYQGRRPSVNPFLSVTRVGRQTQSNLGREIAREITSFLNLYEKMQTFIHFGAELNESIKTTLATGEKVLQFFNQTSEDVVTTNLSTVLFAMLWGNIWEKKDYSQVESDINKIKLAYKMNKEVRSVIDKLLEADSFNKLLGLIKQQGPQILNLSNKYGK